ncbi:MAG: arsenite transporter [Actinobacteria bacterium HGW-Actinobacteria-7]|nr:MAG: arsenite transporter [Actinobacteria bacterium HGW-Actinobacteria-7]
MAAAINAPLHPVVRFLGGLSKQLVWLIPAAIVAGLVSGVLADLSSLKAAVLPLTMLMVYPMLVNFKIAEAFSLKDFKAVALAMVLDLVVLPLVAWGIARAFFSHEPQLYVGMILAGLFPTSGMTISWTGFAKGNVGAAVKMTVIGLIAASFLAPFYLLAFAGSVVNVDLAEIARTVGLVILVPMLAGTLTRTGLVKAFGAQRYQKRIAPVFPGISTLGVLAIVFVAVGLKAPMIVSKPQLLLTIAVPLLLFYGANFVLSTVVGRWLLPRGDAIALVYGTVMRNLSIALGVAIASFGPEAALVLAGAYIVQVQAAAWYVKATDRVFGPIGEPATTEASAQPSRTAA